MKTVEEIEKLKKNWMNDPCWDIEDTEGFEDHKDELLSFRKEYENKCNIQWEAKRQKLYRSSSVVVRPDSDNMYDGLTKRELFAAMAMQSFITHANSPIAVFCTKKAVEFADALLNELDTKRL